MKLVIDLTNKCNLKCKHCGNANELINDKDIDFIPILQNFPFKISKVDLMGGEPLLYYKTNYLLQYLNENKIPFSIITNGQFDESFAKKILLDSLTSISISIDGLREENDFIRGIGSFEKARFFIGYLLKNRNEKETQIGINFVVNRLNFRKIHLIIKELLVLEIDYINLNQIFELGNAIGNKEILIDDDEYLDALELICKNFKEEVCTQKISFELTNPILVEYLNIKYHLNLQSEFDYCDAARQTLYIDNQGNIYPCRNYKCKLQFDNLLADMNKSSKYLLELECGKMIEPYCNDCRFVDECYTCPLSYNKKYVLCQEIEKRLANYYDSYKEKFVKWSKEVFHIELEDKIVIVNPSTEANYILDKNVKIIFDNLKKEVSLYELSKKCGMDYYEVVDMIISLRDKGVFEIYGTEKNNL